MKKRILAFGLSAILALSGFSPAFAADEEAIFFDTDSPFTEAEDAEIYFDDAQEPVSGAEEALLTYDFCVDGMYYRVLQAPTEEAEGNAALVGIGAGISEASIPEVLEINAEVFRITQVLGITDPEGSPTVLRRLFIPAGVSLIDEKVQGGSEALTIIAEEGSFAQQFALERGLSPETINIEAANEENPKADMEEGADLSGEEAPGEDTPALFTDEENEALFAIPITTGENTADVLDTFTDRVSSNTREPYYSNYGDRMLSGMIVNKDGTYTRVEEVLKDDRTVIAADTYTADGTCIQRKEILPELPLIGGYYGGETHNFLIFGQKNPEESDQVEILRIVKYSKTWEREGAASVYGANTLEPFAAAGFSCTEADGKLLIHTGHVMYKSSDGLNHQANMTYVVDEASMQIVDSMYLVLWATGYVSHSFYQAIRSDGESVYRLDLGDAYPRGIALSRSGLHAAIQGSVQTTIFPIQGDVGDNYTGVMPGGFELTENACIVTGTSVDQSSPEAYRNSQQRNVFYIIAPKDFGSSKTVWITDYAEDAGIMIPDNKLVKLSEEVFAVLWTEYKNLSREGNTMLCLMDADGNQLMQPRRINASLSYCQPFVSEYGTICWYLNNGSQLVLYEIDPYKLDKSLFSCTITAGTAEVYDGSPKTVQVSVRDGEKLLREGVDYSLTYDNNVHASSHAAAVITGMGDYTGTVRKDFAIPARALRDMDVEVSLGPVCDKNTKQHIDPEILWVKADGKTLKEGLDYTVSYSSSGTDGGWVWIDGKGDYEGYVSRYYSVHQMEKISASDKSVELGCVGCSLRKYETFPADFTCLFGTTDQSGYYYYGPEDFYHAGSRISLWISAEAYTQDSKADGENNEYIVESSDPEVVRVESVGSDIFRNLYFAGGGTCILTVYPKYNPKLRKTITLSVKGPQTELEEIRNEADGVVITWKAFEKAKKYRIFKKTGNSGWKKLADTKALSYTDTAVSSGSSCAYTVRAIGANAKYISEYDETGLRIVYLAPTGKVTCTNRDNGLEISWTAVKGAQQYEIFRAAGKGSSSYLTTVYGDTSFVDTTAANGKKYTYTVKAGSGMYSSALSKPKDYLRLNTPKLSSVTASAPGTVTVKWNKNASVTGYQIRIKNADSVKTVLVKSAGTVQKTISSLKAGNTTVYVRCFKNAGGIRYYSAFSAAKTVNISN